MEDEGVEELVKKAKRNDEDAFNELILLTQKEMYLIAKTKLKNEDDIADAIQETILSCYKNLRKLRNNKFFKTWLIKILMNECNKIYKKRKKQMVSYEEKETENYWITEDISFENISFDILIRNLNDEEKLILTLYYYVGYSTKEISKLLKIKESTCRSKIARAKIKLRNEFEGGSYGTD